MSFASIAIGAGVGLAGSLIMPAVQGKPITLKGALIGAGTGALTGGVAHALAPAASAATSTASNAATTGLGQIGGQAVKTGATEAAKTAATEAAKTAGTEAVKTGAAEAAKTAGAEAAKTGVTGLPTTAPLGPQAAVNPITPMSPVTAPAPLEPIPTSDILGTGISTGSKTLDKVAGEQAISGTLKGGEMGLGAYQDAQAQKAQNKNYAGSAAEMAADAAMGQNMANDLYSNQIKGPMLAKGGSIHMDSGSFVIPADIVSALGDGSTEAGFRFLESFFRDTEEA